MWMKCRNPVLSAKDQNFCVDLHSCPWEESKSAQVSAVSDIRGARAESGVVADHGPRHTRTMNCTENETVLGLGHDVVAIGEFAEQLDMPGSRMGRLFSARELRQSQELARMKCDKRATHLAARWAGKEAVVKAWSEALEGNPAPYGLDGIPWSEIEILDDSRGRPGIYMGVDMQNVLIRSLCLGKECRLIWHLSLSHDGNMASAVALLTGTSAGRLKQLHAGESIVNKDVYRIQEDAAKSTCTPLQ